MPSTDLQLTFEAGVVCTAFYFGDTINYALLSAVAFWLSTLDRST